MMMNNPTESPVKARGFTLTEIMVAMTVSMILLGGVMQIFTSTKRGSVFNETQSRIQENLRFSVNLMAQDIRMAGYDGCSGTSVTNTIEDGSSKYDLEKPIQGYEGGVDTFPTEITSSPYYDSNLDSDVLMIIRGGQDTGLRVASVQPNSAQFFVNAQNHGIMPGDILMLTDCTHTAVFQVTNSNQQNRNIVHQTGSTHTPGNCTKGLGTVKSQGHSGILCNDPNISVNGTPYTWKNGASVVGFSISYYWVGTSVSGTTRSLYKTSLATGAAMTTEELVEGVEDFQVLFGQTASATSNFANRYLKANQVRATADNFKSTVNVKLGLTLVSNKDIKPKATTKTFTIADKVTTNTDKKLRYFINNTVKPRNRGIM